jgi:hypothetical protein
MNRFGVKTWSHSHSTLKEIYEKICACLFGAKIYNIPSLLLLCLLFGFIFKLSLFLIILM